MNRETTDDPCCCWCRDRQQPVLAPDHTASEFNFRNINPVSADLIEANGCTNYVNNGVNCTHLMKMNLMQGFVMYNCFSFGYMPEYLHRQLSDRSRQTAFIDYLFHVGKIPVLMVMVLVLLMTMLVVVVMALFMTVPVVMVAVMALLVSVSVVMKIVMVMPMIVSMVLVTLMALPIIVLVLQVVVVVLLMAVFVVMLAVMALLVIIPVRVLIIIMICDDCNFCAGDAMSLIPPDIQPPATCIEFLQAVGQYLTAYSQVKQCTQVHVSADS